MGTAVYLATDMVNPTKNNENAMFTLLIDLAALITLGIVAHHTVKIMLDNNSNHHSKKKIS